MPTSSNPGQAQYGVFFDGTGNNYRVDQKFSDDTFEPTNIAKLFELYAQSEDQRIGKQYINGVGTRDAELKKSGDDADYSGLEMAFGLGIKDRIDEAVAGIKAFLQSFNDVEVLYLDIFGFSRGAATARILVNHIYTLNQQTPDCWNGTKIMIRFLGIFDTVGSIGIAGDGKNAGFNLHVNGEAVKYACHITAHHECRKYFPLSTLKDKNGQLASNFFEQELLGAHSDIGGGYGPGENLIYLDSSFILYGGKEDKREAQRLDHIASQAAEWKTKWQDYLNGKWKDSDGPIEVKERRIQKNGPEGQPNSHKQLIRYIWHRTVDKRLSHVALHLMIEHARNHAIPLFSIDSLKQLATPLDYEVPAELADYMIAVTQGDNLMVKPFLALYPEFIHHSHQFAVPEGGLGLINPNATSDGKRQILVNDPQQGLHS